MIKTLNELVIEKTYLNTINGNSWLRAYTMVKSWMLFLRSGIRQKCPISKLLFNVVLKGLARSIGPKEIKKNRI